VRRTARLFRAAAAAALAAAGGPALAQDVIGAGGRGPVVACPPPTACPPAATAPSTAAPTAPPTAAPVEPLNTTPPPAAAAPAAEPAPSFAGLLAGAGPGSTTAVSPGGYIDSALPVNGVRLRGDFAYDNNRPDRASFFYPKCGCFMTRDAKGPVLPERSVDYQEVTAQVEAKLAPRFSVFGEVPVRFINPEVNANTSGLGDVNFGFKYAAVLTDTRILTFQLRTITPSGDGVKGLGSENWWVEPGVLWQTQTTDRLVLFGELRDAIPVSRTSDFAGNVLRYGVGAGYALYSGPRARVYSVNELVGWTVLSGKESSPDIPTPDTTQSARGDTIVNLKTGVRIGFGPVTAPGVLGRSDLYVGYGRALTGEVWYKDMFRLEYRIRF
jgi:hypothetical protein